MPLGSLATLQWFGPATGAMIVEPQASADLGLKSYGRMNMETAGLGQTAQLKGTRLINSPLTVQGLGEIVPPTMRSVGRMGMVVSVNSLTQSDVTGAVLEAKVDGNFTLKEVLRLLAAAAAGKVSGAETGTITFRDLNDTKNRLVANVDANGNRTAVTKDAT